MEQTIPHILIVDDDPDLRSLLQRYLGEQGFSVTAVPDGTAMKEYLAEQSTDLIIMDLMLPGEDGLSLTRQLRVTSNTPVIILSAKGDEIDRIIGLEIGADDYLPKPFNPRELVARIRAVRRRRQNEDRNTPLPHESSNIYRFGPYALNIDSYSLHKEGKEMPLTSGEFALLEVLAQHPNNVLSRDRLIDLLKGYDRSPFDRSIDVRITRLRHKIERNPKKPQYIRTIWGKGYLFTPKGKAA